MSDLKDRIREVAVFFGGINQLADAIAVPRRTFGSWLEGRAPRPEALGHISEVTGCSLRWLILGEGPMLQVQKPAYDPAVFEKLAGLVDRVHREADVKLPSLALASQAGYLFEELLKRVSDVNDAAEVEAAMPLLEYSLKKQLREAANEPGTGKRGA